MRDRSEADSQHSLGSKIIYSSNHAITTRAINHNAANATMGIREMLDNRCVQHSGPSFRGRYGEFRLGVFFPKTQIQSRRQLLMGAGSPNLSRNNLSTQRSCFVPYGFE